MKTILILPDGTVQFLGDDPGVDLPLGKVRRTRVSTILPCTAAKRCAFRVIRWLCGDRGSAAAWTRTWKCEWRATILATGESAVFENRQACVDWEYQVLSGPKFEL